MSIYDLVSPADVAERFGRTFTSAETDRAAVLIYDAAVLLAGDQDLSVVADIESGDLDEETVRVVIANMAKRAMQSQTDGVVQEQTGPFGRTFSNPTGDVFLKESERSALSAGKRPRAATRRMGY
jgi:hypothetical protein